MRSLLLFAAIFMGSALVASAKLKPADFVRMDADEDGFLDPAEFIGTKKGAALKRALKSFAKLDADDDSLISAVEALGKKAAGTGSIGATESISSSWATTDIGSVAGYVASISNSEDRDSLVAAWLANWEEVTVIPPAGSGSPRPPRE